MKIKHKQEIRYNGKVFDISVENSHTYNVEGLGVHNSVGGSLVAYMTKQITLVDPIPHGLLFSRFFNAARSYPKHLSFNECPFVDVWRDVGI